MANTHRRARDGFSPIHEQGICSASASPHTRFDLDITDAESLYAATDNDGTRALVKLDEVMNAVNYPRPVPPGTDGVERVRAASLGSVVFRNRILLHYEQTDLGRPELERPGSLGADMATESLESLLVSGEETLPGSFVGGTIVRPKEPRHIGTTDDRSPIIVDHTAIGSTEDAPSAGFLVMIKNLAGRWRILTMGEMMTVIS